MAELQRLRQLKDENRYQRIARDQTALRMRVRELAAARVRYGYRRLHVLLNVRKSGRGSRQSLTGQHVWRRLDWDQL